MNRLGALSLAEEKGYLTDCLKEEERGRLNG